MFPRLKKALVDSFVGAIAVGFLFAEGAQQIMSIFTAPFASWIELKEMHWLLPQSTPEPALLFRSSLPHLAQALFLLAMSWVLLRWLYYPPRKNQEQGRAPEQRHPEQTSEPEESA